LSTILASRRILPDGARRESSKADERYIAMFGIVTGSLGNGVLDVSGMV
jgi:hypothetical protein